MPRAPRKCPAEGCETRITGRAYCPEHTEVWAGSTRGADDAEWRRVRLRVLDRDDGRCWMCRGDGADTVDHLTPKAAGGSDGLDNLAAIHDRAWPHCHRAKTALDRLAMARRWPPDRYRSAIGKLCSDLRKRREIGPR
ncbi:HNH endonuclease family protein [Nocardia nova SH22a]|uniref:HNH endonuclease family protein n=1 Tax=Nocardia nova SH22a TaxID=1415166 RepID=W5TPH9_9NOCA|nr:HNH endonuclease signature motif containing protein [Nocardia nova]AHH20843.1 HNH endonuclease family protein [Nocardia nova SH22a]